MRLIQRILAEAWRYKRGAVMAYFCGALLETASFIVSIYATARLSGLLAAFGSGGDTSGIWFWLWVDIVGVIGISGGFWLMDVTKTILHLNTTQWATRQFHTALCRIDIQDFYDDEVRNQLNKAQSGYTWQLSNFLQASLDLMYGIIRFIATAAIVAQITWWLIPLIAIFLIPSLLAKAKQAKAKWFVWDSEGDTRHIFWGLEWLLRQAKNQMELRSTQARGYVLTKLDTMNSRFYDEQERRYRRTNRLVLPASMLEVAGTAIGSVVLLRQFLSSAISLERYFFLSGALLRIGFALNNIFGTLSRMQEMFLFVDNYFSVLDRQPQIVDKPGAAKLSATGAPEIIFERVSFTYPGQDSPVFKDLSFTIKPGERLAIVGENGAGKSTLIKLLLRFYRPTGGRILLNGEDLQALAIDSWYDRLATLFQDFNQYPFPISENIEVARPIHAGDTDRLKHAARMSNVNSMVAKYQHGWDTVLDNSFEKGVEPSGGQWQRVALARAFYRQADVLILDEPTAAIDAKAEYDIFNNIFAEYAGKTAIIVSHRFSTVRKADRILVFEHGKVIEDGTHKELMRLDGTYADMFNKQAEGYR